MFLHFFETVIKMENTLYWNKWRRLHLDNCCVIRPEYFILLCWIDCHWLLAIFSLLSSCKCCLTMTFCFFNSCTSLAASLSLHTCSSRLRRKISRAQTNKPNICSTLKAENAPRDRWRRRICQISRLTRAASHRGTKRNTTCAAHTSYSTHTLTRTAHHRTLC